MASLSIDRLRAHAVTRTLFTPTTLKAAIDGLGFVQADPIRAPARAQDLILRHRVAGYRAGDLERRYPSLKLEEDLLHAYGFLPRQSGLLLHPRDAGKLEPLDRRVLEVVRSGTVSHPRELEAHFGAGRVVNAWGGYSKATKRALERLHYRGLVRVIRRENGVRVYEATTLRAQELSPDERVRKLVQLVAALLAPVQERTLRAIAARLRRDVDGAQRGAALKELLRSGELERDQLHGIPYIWPAGSDSAGETPRRVRFLAPFDPLVWDRRRFEHLWGWSYRFEAYTPPQKRVRGYYAMPLLWGDSIIGWANATRASHQLDFETGFIERRPKGRDFTNALDAEIAELNAFLGQGS